MKKQINKETYCLLHVRIFYNLKRERTAHYMYVYFTISRRQSLKNIKQEPTQIFISVKHVYRVSQQKQGLSKFLTTFSKILFCRILGMKKVKCDKRNKKNIFGTLKKIPQNQIFFEKLLGLCLLYCFIKFHKNSLKIE